MKRALMAAIVFVLIMSMGCLSSPSPAPASAPAPVSVQAPVSGPDELDLSIRDASDYLNDNIPQGSKIVILNVQSDSAALSDYIIDELIANAVNDRVFDVVDRQQLDIIRAEQNFQWAGEVDDNLALEVGRFVGAQTIVSGRVIQMGDRFRMTIRALDVQTAQVQGQYNRNMAAGATIIALMSAGGSFGGTAYSAPKPAGSSGGTAQSTPAAIAGGTASRASSGATSGTASNSVGFADLPVPDGATGLNVNNVSTWNSAINRIRSGGNGQIYVINVNGNVSVPAPPSEENIFGALTGITVIIQGTGTLSLSVNGTLLRVGAGQTVVLRNVTVRGRADNDNPVVRIMSGGIFRMEGTASVTGNSGYGNTVGVFVDGGVFIMRDRASVSGNTQR